MLSLQVKFSADRQADRQTNRRISVKQYAPNLSMRGHKNRNEASTDPYTSIISE